jgi:Ca2+-transporting ATPase
VTGDQGLSSSEAEARLAEHGPNILVHADRAAWLKELGALLLDPMALMLLAAAGIYMALGERRDAMVMLVALVPVIGVDVFLEARSRSALKKLARSVAPRARVRRDGREIIIDTAELVPGDRLLLVEGDFVHADGVVRSAANLALDESSLTGESEPQPKGEGQPFYAGSTVLAGHGEGEVLATGRATRFGEIARLVAAADTTATPLQRRVGRMVRRLAVVAAAVAIALLALGLARGQGWSQALLGGISLAMSAAPEEFPLVFTLFLSVGAWRLGRRGVLVRRLASVETLGSTTVICTDKTGTLTEGQFRLDVVVPLGARSAGELLAAAVLACEVPATDPMEKAIVARASSDGAAAALPARWRLARDHDFDPAGKHMTHVWSSRDEPGRAWIVAKGAFEGVVQHCAIGAAELAAAEAEHARLAGQGIRVLAVAERQAPFAERGTRAEDERDLTLVGLLGFRDPVRPEVPDAVSECQAAGVRIKIVTGDHALTAHAVADRAGIIHSHSDDSIVSSDQLARAGEPERQRLILEASVLSRITPAGKHTIVETLQEEGEIVAMTGDGINDAPALRRADIGISMGRRGTEVARAAADLVLLDDDFASIVAAVREGRKIFLDIQRAFLYLLAFHVPIVGLALAAPLAGVPLLLMPVHLVWLELVVHPVSALAFQGDPPPRDLMRQPPRDPRAPMLPRAAMVRSALSGGLLTLVVFLFYLWKLGQGAAPARTLALATLIIGYQLLVIVERAGSAREAAAFLPRAPRFWMVWLATGVSLPILMYLPAAAHVVGLARASVSDWLLAVAGACAAIGWRFPLAMPARRRHT